MGDVMTADAGRHETPLLEKFPPLLKNRNFLLLWTGYVVSALGDRIHFIVMLALISKVVGSQIGKPDFEAGTKENAQLTIMMLLPFLLFGPVTGIIADRFPRRMIMLTCDLARVAVVIAARMVFIRESDIVGPVALYAILLGTEFLLAMFAACFSPARLAIMPQLVHPDQLLRANSMTNATGTIASLIGFVVGGVLVRFSLNMAMFVDAGTFAVSGLCLLMMRLSRTAAAPAVGKNKPGVIRELTDGLRYIFSHKRVMQVIVLMLLFWTCGTVILNGLTGIVTEHFHLRIVDYANFMGVVGLGMVIGAASVSLARHAIPKEVGIAWAMVGVGVFLWFFSQCDRWQWALVFLVFSAACGAVLLVSLETLLQRIVPNYVRGRVMGAKDVITTLGLISVAIPLAIWKKEWGDLNELIRTVLWWLSLGVVAVGVGLVVLYYRTGRLPTPVAILSRFGRAYLSVWHRFDVGNAARIPLSGPTILVANHTTGYDPLIMQIASKHRLIQFMMAKEYYEMKGLKWFYKWLGVIPVNRSGNDTASIRTAIRSLKDGACIGMFPEGRISEDGRMNEGRPGVALLALMSRATVVPAYIRGTHPHKGMVTDFLKRARVTVFFGRPIRFDDIKGHDEEAREEANRRIMGAIKGLRDRYETDAFRRTDAVAKNEEVKDGKEVKEVKGTEG